MPSDTGDTVRAAIGQAAQRTGVNFSYLLAQAKSESGLNPSAKAGNSTATGLYQFLDQSWLGVVKQHGAEHGRLKARARHPENAKLHVRVAHFSGNRHQRRRATERAAQPTKFGLLFKVPRTRQLGRGNPCERRAAIFA